MTGVATPAQSPIARLGRYELHAPISRGGMATVHLGRLRAEVGFSRCVAIKRLHEQFAHDPEFIDMFIDEARLAARVRHPNVVPMLDVISVAEGLFLVMEYVHGESLSRVSVRARKAGIKMPPDIAVAIAIDMLEGLHAAHEAKSERGVPLEIVHRDVSPQNVLVGSDGVGRILDFGVAKAADRIHSTRDGSVKGKFAYMAPEQVSNAPIGRAADIWAAAVVLWELLVGKRLFDADSPAALVQCVLHEPIAAPSTQGAPAGFDDVVLKGLARDPAQRFHSAREMAQALEQVHNPASKRAVAAWLDSVVGDTLKERAARVEEMESADDLAPTSDEPYDDNSITIADSPSDRHIEAATASSSGLTLPIGANDMEPTEPESRSFPPFGTGHLVRTQRARRLAIIGGAIAASLALVVALAVASRDEPRVPEATAVTTVSAPPPTTVIAPSEPASAPAPAASAIATPSGATSSAAPPAIATHAQALPSTRTAPPASQRSKPPGKAPPPSKAKSEFGTSPW